MQPIHRKALTTWNINHKCSKLNPTTVIWASNPQDVIWSYRSCLPKNGLIWISGDHSACVCMFILVQDIMVAVRLSPKPVLWNPSWEEEQRCSVGGRISQRGAALMQCEITFFALSFLSFFSVGLFVYEIVWVIELGCPRLFFFPSTTLASSQDDTVFNFSSDFYQNLF